jgi:hypothetical protein
MNERIKELAEEASNGSDYDLECVTDAFLQIFAEAIVQECANIYEGVYTDQQRPERIDKRIKEHFGVK